MGEVWQSIENDITGQPLPITQDPTGTWIYCSREVWHDHILKRHAEIATMKDLIAAAILSPEFQDTDPEDLRVIRYYIPVPKERMPSAQQLWLRVVVKYTYPPERNNQRTGLLSSVYLVHRKE